MGPQLENTSSSQTGSGAESASILDIIIWAHSDQDGGTELACVLAKTFMEESKSLQVGIVTAKPNNVRNFFTYETVGANDLCIISCPSLLRMEKRSGSVDAEATRELLLKDPFQQENDGTFHQLMRTVESLKDDLIAPRVHERTLMISTGEPIAVEIAAQLRIKCVIVSDHLLTSSIRWLLRNGGLFDKGMAHLFTMFEDFDRKADKAFLSPVEFAGEDYETYLGQGGIDCNFIGGLFYEPISETKLRLNRAYLALKREARNHDIVFVFGGGGPVWFSLFNFLHNLARDNQFRNFALLIPSMMINDEQQLVRERHPITGKFLYTLYLPEADSVKEITLEDPGRLMYWYAACKLVVARGGLAAQQILATMMSDSQNHPEMLFIEEPGHTQIEHERQSLYNLGFVHTRTLNSFRSHPIDTIQEVLAQIRPHETSAKVRVRYGKEMMKGLINCLIELYLT